MFRPPAGVVSQAAGEDVLLPHLPSKGARRAIVFAHVLCTSINAIGSITSVNAIESAGEMWSRINVHGDGLAFNVHGDGLQLL